MVYTTHSRLGVQLSFLSERPWIYPQTIDFNALVGAWTSRLGTALPETLRQELLWACLPQGCLPLAWGHLFSIPSKSASSWSLKLNIVVESIPSTVSKLEAVEIESKQTHMDKLLLVKLFIGLLPICSNTTGVLLQTCCYLPCTS